MMGMPSRLLCVNLSRAVLAAAVLPSGSCSLSSMISQALAAPNANMQHSGKSAWFSPLKIVMRPHFEVKYCVSSVVVLFWVFEGCAVVGNDVIEF